MSMICTRLYLETPASHCVIYLYTQFLDQCSSDWLTWKDKVRAWGSSESMTGHAILDRLLTSQWTSYLHSNEELGGKSPQEGCGQGRGLRTESFVIITEWLSETVFWILVPENENVDSQLGIPYVAKTSWKSLFPRVQRVLRKMGWSQHSLELWIPAKTSSRCQRWKLAPSTHPMESGLEYLLVSRDIFPFSCFLLACGE
jgi:hypothetical protein